MEVDKRRKAVQDSQHFGTITRSMQPQTMGERGLAMSTVHRLLLPLVLFSSLASAEGNDRSTVSTAIEERVGHGLASVVPATSTESRIPPEVTVEDGLTEDEAVALALWNNAALRATLANLGLAQADLKEAGLLVNPNFQLLFPIGVKPFEFLLMAPIQALWERPRRLAAARLTLDGVAQQLVQNGLDLVRDVRLAHADYAAATAQAGSAGRLASVTEEIAELNQKRLDAGDISELDLQLTRLEALAARDQAAQLEQETSVAWERLRLLSGLPHVTARVRPEGLEGVSQSTVWIDALLETASQSRPDLRAAELAVEAAGNRLGWERSRTFALVAPLLSSKEVGDSGTKTGPGLTAEIPIFNRGQGRISRAEAEIEQLALRYAALRVQVESETATAATRLRQAVEALQRMRQGLLPAAEQAVGLAEKAYENGDISYLDRQTARRPFLDLQLREGAAVAAARRAKAELDRAVGRNL